MTKHAHGEAENARRAKRAYTRIFQPAVLYSGDMYQNPQEILIDLLTDLRHLQQRWGSMGLDLDTAIQTSQWHFDEETR